MAVILWRFTDGKPGHDIQSRGLAQALRAETDVAVFELAVEDGASGFGWWLAGRYPRAAALPAPDLLLGAGHATHGHLLAARRSRGGRIILLMKPSLPVRCFDLCLIPEHDSPPHAANVLPTLGVLNDIQFACAPRSDTGLIALGGPSRHFHWDDSDVLAQIECLRRERPVTNWVLTGSRRTPRSLTRRLAASTGLEYIPCSDTGRGWLQQRFADAAEVWISEDSISMIYEALSAGARPGLLQLRRGRANRVSAGIDTLVGQGRVGRPGDWRLPQAPPEPLNEAARCARWIKRSWLTAH